MSFSGSVAALSRATLVSKFINYPYRVVQFSASFALGTNRTLRLSPLIDRDASAPTTLPIMGTNLLAQTGEVEFIVGDDERKVMTLGVEQIGRGTFLKVHANNLDTFDHTIDAQITIEILELEEKEPQKENETTESPVEAS